MTLSCNPLALAVLSCAALFGTAAHASPISMSFSGTIQYGFDSTGEFGTGGTDLTGRTVEVHYGFDSSQFGAYSYGNDQSVSQTVTVDGVSKQYTLDLSNSSSYSVIYSALSMYGSGNYYYDYWSYWYSNHDQVYHSNSGYFAAGGYLDSYQSVYSFNNPMSPPTDGTSSWSYLTQAGDQSYGAFSIYDANWSQTAYFGNTVDRITLNGASAFAPAALKANAVPEPATLALACLALMGVVGSRRALQQRFKPQPLPSA